jgi:DnaK suppressor protein
MEKNLKGKMKNAKKLKEKATAKPKVDKPRVIDPSGKKFSEYVKEFKEALIHKKSSLTNHLRTELSELEAPDKHHLADLEEMASDTHDTDSVCEIMAVGANTIDQIDLALAKIDDGTYGVCEDCGEHIALERLEAIPFATLCIECKKKKEIYRSSSS